MAGPGQRFGNRCADRASPEYGDGFCLSHGLLHLLPEAAIDDGASVPTVWSITLVSNDDSKLFSVSLSQCTTLAYGHKT